MAKLNEVIKMPSKPKVPCQHPGCAELVTPGTKFCERHKPLHPETSRLAAKRGYGRQWQKARKQFLAAHFMNFFGAVKVVYRGTII